MLTISGAGRRGIKRYAERWRIGLKHRLMFVVEGEDFERTRERDIPEFSGTPALAGVGDTVLLENAEEGGRPVHAIVTEREFSYFQDLVSVLFRVKLSN